MVQTIWGDWLPIEDAPQDRRPVLATHSENVAGIMHVCYRMEKGSEEYLNPRTGRAWKPDLFQYLPLHPRQMRGLLAESLPYLDREAERQRQAINANLGSSREGWRAAVNLRARISDALLAELENK